jgi:transposase
VPARMRQSDGLRRMQTVSLPNGVKLALECGDVDALTAIIGALGDV